MAIDTMCNKHGIDILYDSNYRFCQKNNDWISDPCPSCLEIKILKASNATLKKHIETLETHCAERDSELSDSKREIKQKDIIIEGYSKQNWEMKKRIDELIEEVKTNRIMLGAVSDLNEEQNQVIINLEAEMAKLPTLKNKFIKIKERLKNIEVKESD